MRKGLYAFVFATAAATALSAACSGDDDSSALPTKAPSSGSGSSSNTASIGAATQDLTISGPINGKMFKAETTCSMFKATSANDKDRFQVVLVGDAGGANRRIRIIFFGYNGAGDYKATSDAQTAVVQVEVDQAGGRGSGKINADLRSGTVDADILSPSAGKLTGSWKCP